MENESFNLNYDAPRFYDFESSHKSDFNDSFFDKGDRANAKFDSVKKTPYQEKENIGFNGNKHTRTSADGGKNPLVDSALINLVSNGIDEFSLVKDDSPVVIVKNHAACSNGIKIEAMTGGFETSMPNLCAIKSISSTSTVSIVTGQAEPSQLAVANATAKETTANLMEIVKIGKRSVSEDAAIRLYPKPTIPQTPKLRTALRSFKHKNLIDPANAAWPKAINAQNQPYKPPLHAGPIITEKLSRNSSKNSVAEINGNGSSTPVLRRTPSVVTKPCPFSFQQREQALLDKRNKLVEDGRKQLEASMKASVNFKASAAPRCSPVVVLPARRSLTTTNCRPFRLITDERCAIHEQQQKLLREMEDEKRLKLMQFRARPAAVLSHAPFKPRRLDHSPIVCNPIQLSTARRAEDRQKFDDFVKEKDEEKAKIMEERRLEEEAIEQKEIQEMRRRQVHKAQPVRHYKDVEPRVKPHITLPISPKLKTAKRKTKEK